MEESELRNTAPEYDPKPCPLCGRTMRRGLIQSGGVLYFTDEEKYWINWPLKSRGDIPLLGGKLFPTFPDDGATNVPLPGLRTRKPSCSSSLSAMRTVVRLMPKESCSCFSDGRIEPGG